MSDSLRRYLACATILQIQREVHPIVTDCPIRIDKLSPIFHELSPIRQELSLVHPAVVIGIANAMRAVANLEMP